jgi:PemK-like protein.
MANGARFKKWEIWRARVVYDDDIRQYKNRPVLIYDDQKIYVLSFKITSHAPRSNFPGEYRIKQWHIAGLDGESTVRLSKAIHLKDQDFIGQIGRLHRSDITGILDAMANMDYQI